MTLGGVTTGFSGFEEGVVGGDDNQDLIEGDSDELGGGNAALDDSEGSGI